MAKIMKEMLYFIRDEKSRILAVGSQIWEILKNETLKLDAKRN